eukprot:15552598-Heterocapsa_arctica.AAC.1
MKAQQSQLVRELLERELAGILATAAPPDAALCRSAGGTGAGSWLLPPQGPGHHMPDPHYAI